MFQTFLNSTDNLCIACGQCNLIKKDLQKGTLSFVNNQTADFCGMTYLFNEIMPLQQVYDDAKKIFNVENPRVFSMVVSSLMSFAQGFSDSQIPIIHLRMLGLITLSAWCQPGDPDFLALKLQ